MIGKRMVMVVSVVMAVIILFAAGSTPALAGIQDGKISTSEFPYYLGSIVWHFDVDSQQWQVWDRFATEKTNTLKTISFLGEYWVRGITKWKLRKGSDLIWSSVRSIIVEDWIEQKFKELDNMSVDEIVQQAWREKLGEEAPISAISSIEYGDFLRLYSLFGGGDGKRVGAFFWYRFEYFTFPYREDRTKIVESRIVYPRKSADLIGSIWMLAHEYGHARKFQDWRHRSLAPSYHEDVANLGATVIGRYLQEKYGMPILYSEDYEKEYFYDWASKLGTEEQIEQIQENLRNGYPGADSMAKLFKSLQ